MAEVKLFGYCNNISVRPGNEQTFHVTADGTDTAGLSLYGSSTVTNIRTVRVL